MKKKVLGRKFKRDKNERKALFKSLMTSLVIHERIETTEEKAKTVRPIIEKLITNAKKGGNSSILRIKDSISHIAYDKLIKELAPRFKNRQGGYTRIIRLGERLGDKAQMVILEWTEAPVSVGEVKAVEKNIVKDKKDKVVKKSSKKEADKKIEKKPVKKVEKKIKK